MRAITLVLVSIVYSGCYLLEERDELGLVYQSDPASFPAVHPPPAPSYDAGMTTPDAALPAPDAGHPVEDAGMEEPDAFMPEPDLGPAPEPDAGSDAWVDPCRPPTGDGPELTVEVVARRPRLQVPMGAQNIELVRYRFTAGLDDDIVIDEVPAVIYTNPAHASFRNYRLEVAGVRVSVADGAPPLPFPGSDTAGMPFYAPRVTIIRGTSVDVALVADANSYLDGALSGAELRAGFSRTCYPWAHGATTGVPVNPSAALDLTSGFNYNSHVFGESVFVYRSVITVARDASSPSGDVTGEEEQVLAVFRVVATSPGGYTAYLQVLNLDIGSTFFFPDPRLLRVYVDEVRPDNLVASYMYDAMAYFTDTEWSDDAFEDIAITPDIGRLIYITANTAGAAHEKLVTIGLDNGDILWSDGVTTDIAECNSTPVAGLTLSYVRPEI